MPIPFKNWRKTVWKIEWGARGSAEGMQAHCIRAEIACVQNWPINYLFAIFNGERAGGSWWRGWG